MDKELIEKYKKEMLEIYNKSSKIIPNVSQSTEENNEGELIVNVTTLRELYPVKSAKVTVFKGTMDNMEEIDSSFTDESGKTKVFKLKAPNRSLSEKAGEKELPFAEYNILVSADGYVEQAFMNVPVFSGVTSLQNADLTLLASSGNHTGIKITDEKNNFNL